MCSQGIRSHKLTKQNYEIYLNTVKIVIIRVRKRKVFPTSSFCRSVLDLIAKANAIAPLTPENHIKKHFLLSKRFVVRDIFAIFEQTNTFIARENKVMIICDNTRAIVRFLRLINLC